MRHKTVGQAIQRVLPWGTMMTMDSSNDISGERLTTKDFSPWLTVPLLPFDVFAACGHLISSSGLIGFYEPDPEYTGNGGIGSSSDGASTHFSITEEARKNCVSIGEKWRRSGHPELDVQKLWSSLLGSRDEVLRASLARTEGRIPSWWVDALKLVIIADEACEGIGREVPRDDEERLHFAVTNFRIRASRSKDREIGSGATMSQMGRAMATFAASADPDVVAVQPKCRIAGTGCSMRNLTKNLALTAPVGSVRCHWQQLLTKPKSEDEAALDILLVPIPYSMQANWFQPVQDGRSRDQASYSKRPRWDNFSLRQEWNKNSDQVVNTVTKLIEVAQRDVDTVNAIILPAFAVTFEIFEKICLAAKKAEPQIEFLIAGSSSNCEGEHCNNVLTAVWENPGRIRRRRGRSSGIAHETGLRVTSQRKHHRWRLERNQISAYALASSLNPKLNWWESHNIEQRELNFFQFRESSVFSSLICEDLARSDPCHEILRSIGPNLVFALLMDGPQIPQRWSGRYAGTLADDPGSSVLTLTSFGLIKRMNENREFEESHTVGLWREASGITKEIVLPEKAGGILLSLAGYYHRDQTIDGRVNETARTWRYHSQHPLFLPEASKKR